MTVLQHPLAEISARARPYPAHMLPAGGTALALFAAAYLGHNDAIHFARKDMVATCVDVDAERLAEMSMVYPDDWTFVDADAWDFARVAQIAEMRWDAVSVDTFIGDATDRSLKSLELWCTLANKIVTVTLPADNVCGYSTDGFTASVYPRSDLANWLVLTRD